MTTFGCLLDVIDQQNASLLITLRNVIDWQNASPSVTPAK
jgi:hypothetical protein